MQDTLRALLALQELDEDIFRVREELKRLPREREQRREGVAAIEARKAALEGAIFERRTRIREIEDESTRKRQRMRKAEGEANSSRGDMALMAAFQHEIKTLKRDIGGLEEEGLELVEQVEGFEGELATVSAQLEQAQKDFAELSDNVDAEMRVAEAKLNELETERARRLSDDVKDEVLGLYDRLLGAREGLALAELDGRICQACFMEVPTNCYVKVARGIDIVQCPSCDRILYQRALKES